MRAPETLGVYGGRKQRLPASPMASRPDRPPEKAQDEIAGDPEAHDYPEDERDRSHEGDKQVRSGSHGDGEAAE